MSRLARAVFVAILVVAGAELAARAVWGHVWFPQCYQVSRNPNFRRGWPAFTTPRPRSPKERLVIVISNSQGFGRELDDGSQAYPGRLRALLRANDPHYDYIVANWSIPGGAGPGMVVLAARAAQHRPDVVLLVTYTTNFAVPHTTKPLSFGISDVGELAYLSSVRRRLSRRFLRHYDASEPLAWLSAHAALLKLRARFLERRREAWEWARGVFRRRLSRPLSVPPLPAEGTFLLREFRDALHSGSRKTQLLVVTMPLNQDKFASWPHLAEFTKQAYSLFRGDPRVTVLNALRIIDPSLFYTATHLKPAGHEQFARWLLPHVQKALTRARS